MVPSACTIACTAEVSVSMNDSATLRASRSVVASQVPLVVMRRAVIGYRIMLSSR